MLQEAEITSNKRRGAKSLPVKKLIATAFVLLAFVGLIYQFTENTPLALLPQQNNRSIIPAGKGPLIEIDTEVGKIRVELFPQHAPTAVTELIKLTESGYYDSDTLMQSQSNLGFAIAKLGESVELYNFEDEQNQLASHRGSMAIAKSSASPAYLNNLFFSYASQPELEKHYVIIGQIIYGLESIERSPSGPRIKINSFKLIDRNQVATKSNSISQ